MIDGAVGFNKSYSWNYHTDGQAVPGEFDFVSDAGARVDCTLWVWSSGRRRAARTAFMLFRYSAPGVRELAVQSRRSHHSCRIFLNRWWPDESKEAISLAGTLHYSTWRAPFGITDTLAAPYPPGLEHVFSLTDALELNALGFDVNMPTNFSVLDTTTNTAFQSDGTPYSGHVAGLSIGVHIYRE